MQIKRFEAKNMTAALRRIKAELGPEAVILSARSIRKGSGILGSFKPASVEVTAAIDTYALKSSEPPIESRKTIDTDYRARDAITHPVGHRRRPAPSAKSLKRGVRAAGVYADAVRNDLTDEKKILFTLYQQLVSQDVDPDIANDVCESVKLIPDVGRRLAQGELNSLLAGLLGHMGVSAEPIQLDHNRPKIVAFVGPTGVGKTTTIAKLAAHFALDQRKALALITFDDLRIAAIDQIKAYASIIGVDLVVATSSSDLRRYLKRFKQKDLILIDTPGLNPKNEDRIKELEDYFTKLNTIEIQLVLSATTKEKDLLDTAGQFAALGTQRLTFTKLDETNTIGNLLNVLIRTTLPFSYIADGQQIPDAMDDASVDKLVALLLRHDSRADVRERTAQSKMVDPMAEVLETARGMRFVANRNSDVYHVPDCKWTKKIKTEHIIAFESAEAAARHNYLPCRNCYPDRSDPHSPMAFDRQKLKVSTRR